VTEPSTGAGMSSFALHAASSNNASAIRMIEA